jgi:hypothetical protein
MAPRKLPPCAAAILPLFTQALNQEIGVGFAVNGMPRDSYKNMMYEVRNASGDPRLQELIIFAPAAPYDNELWIAKKEVELDP